MVANDMSHATPAGRSLLCFSCTQDVEAAAAGSDPCCCCVFDHDACRFLTPSGRAWYVQNMLRAYNHLYGDGVMEAWMAERGPEKLAAQLKDLLMKKA